MIWLKLLGGFFRKFWLPILLFGAVGFVAVNYHKMSLTAMSLEQQNADLLLEVVGLQTQLTGCVGELRSQNFYISALMEKNRLFENRVLELQNRPVPERVVEIREVIKTVERGITAQDCTDAVAEAARIIKGLPR